MMKFKKNHRIVIPQYGNRTGIGNIQLPFYREWRVPSRPPIDYYTDTISKVFQNWFEPYQFIEIRMIKKCMLYDVAFDVNMSINWNYQFIDDIEWMQDSFIFNWEDVLFGRWYHNPCYRKPKSEHEKIRTDIDNIFELCGINMKSIYSLKSREHYGCG